MKVQNDKGNRVCATINCGGVDAGWIDNCSRISRQYLSQQKVIVFFWLVMEDKKRDNAKCITWR
jgi:hypothetical protein